MVRVRTLLHEDEYAAMTWIVEFERRDVKSQAAFLIREALVARGLLPAPASAVAVSPPPTQEAAHAAT